MLCALWPLIPVGKSWWAITSCKLNLSIYLSSAPSLNVTVELNNYWDEPLRELVGFQALDVFIKMKLKAFLQVSIYAMYKLFGSLTDLNYPELPCPGKITWGMGFSFGVFKTQQCSGHWEHWGRRYGFLWEGWSQLGLAPAASSSLVEAKSWQHQC